MYFSWLINLYSMKSKTNIFLEKNNIFWPFINWKIIRFYRFYLELNYEIFSRKYFKEIHQKIEIKKKVK